MSNDTGYRLTFKHASRKTLNALRTFVTVVKPQLSEFVAKIQFPLKMKEQDKLTLLGIGKWSEVVTWAKEWNIGKVTKDDATYMLQVHAWANENWLGNIWISGKDGELADLLRRFPGLEITGTFSDDYGIGSLKGLEKNYEKDRIEADIEDESLWEYEDEGKPYTRATRELFVAARHAELDLKRLKRLIHEGADVNAWWSEAPFIRSLVEGELKNPEMLGKALKMLLSAGLRIDCTDGWTSGVLMEIADILRISESNTVIRRRMAQEIAGEKFPKNVNPAEIFKMGVKSRNITSIFAAIFLGASIQKFGENCSIKDKSWLVRQGFLSE